MAIVLSLLLFTTPIPSDSTSQANRIRQLESKVENLRVRLNTQRDYIEWVTSWERVFWSVFFTVIFAGVGAVAGFVTLKNVQGKIDLAKEKMHNLFDRRIDSLEKNVESMDEKVNESTEALALVEQIQGRIEEIKEGNFHIEKRLTVGVHSGDYSDTTFLAQSISGQTDPVLELQNASGNPLLSVGPEGKISPDGSDEAITTSFETKNGLCITVNNGIITNISYDKNSS